MSFVDEIGALVVVCKEKNGVFMLKVLSKKEKDGGRGRKLLGG